MSSNLYDIYKSNTLQLAKTLVIKSAASADALNAGLIEYKQQVDQTRPETWMYYLNLAGEYHPVNTMMTVLSLDTLEIIDFTKENLLEHRTTAREYTYGSAYYKELVRRYPDQTALIRGIINPVDITTAIEADDHTILYYDTKLVEPWEENLIPELQYWINAYVRKYYHADFSLVENLYIAGVLAMMHYHIPQTIMLIRQKNCRTNYVHSFHLWSYLASHNYLDDYQEFLTRKQAMWLYRDILWAEHNNGKKHTFGYLIDNIMTERGFPIGKYDLRQSSLPQPDVLYPDAGMNFTPLNFLVEQEIQHDNKTVREILEKEKNLARDNPENIDSAEARINFDFTRGLLGNVPTKVLESETTDMSLFTPVRLIDTLFNHWILFASQGVYTTMITVQNPKDGTSMVMSAKDAFVAFGYCLNKAFGVTMTTIPPAEAWDVVQLNRPTFKELRGISESYYVSDYLIRYALDVMPDIRKLVSTEGFYLKCVEIREAALAHRELYSLREHQKSRGQMEGVCRHLFETKRCYFVEGQVTYEDFFKSRNWELLGLDDTTYFEIALEIFNTVTGQDLFYSKSLAEIQAAMIRLLMQLSSYSVHVIQTINTIPAVVSDWRVIRVGDIDVYGYSRYKHPWMPAHVKNWGFVGHGSVDYQLTEQGTQYTASVKSKAGVYLDIGLTYKTTSKTTLYIRGKGPSVYVRRARPKLISSVITKPDLDGLLDWSEYNEGGVVLENKALEGLFDWVQQTNSAGF